MLKFILNTLIMLSLGAIFYLVAKTLPRIDDTAENQSVSPKIHWLMGYLEKADEWLKFQLEKVLRRLKVWILKFDNYVSGRLNKVKKETPVSKSFSTNEEEIKTPIENTDKNSI